MERPAPSPSGSGPSGPGRLFRRALAGLLAASFLLGLVGCDASGVGGEDDGSGDSGDGQTVQPAAPSGLEATPADGAVSLGWDAAEEAETYNVYRDTTSGVDASGSPLAESVEETSYTDQSAENGTTYYYVVTGVADEEGDPSGEAQATLESDTVVPDAPTGLGTDPAGTEEVFLGWDAADDAETYNVYRDTTSGVGASGSPLAEEVAETSYTDEAVEAGETYYYVVTSVADEESDPSGEVSAALGPEAVVPAAPSELEATSGDGEVSLSWEPATDAQTYNVYRDTESGVDASGSPLAEGIEQNGYTDQSAENGTEYFYVVTGVADEEGDPSEESKGAPFASPTGLEGTPGGSQVELGWEAAAGAETYNVYRSTESGVDTSGSPLAEGILGTGYADQSAENGTEYFYVVTSVNADGEESAESEEVEGAPFVSPSELEGTPGGSQVELSWEAGAGAETYAVYRSTEPGVGATDSPLAEDIEGTSYADQSAENGTEYFYVVTSLNTNGEESDPSGEASVKLEPEAVVPAAPSELEATSGDGQVSLSWEAPDDAQTYRVYRDPESGTGASGDPIGEGFDETSYTDGTAENGRTYYYIVTAVADEEGDPSGEAEAAPFASPTGLEGTSGDSQVELSWEAAAGAETYNVYRSTESGTGTSGSPLEEGISETAYTDESAENGTTYYYVITSANPNGEESSPSEEIEKRPFADPPGSPGGS